MRSRLSFPRINVSNVVYSFSGHSKHSCVWNFVLPTVCLYDNRPQADWVSCGISIRYCMVSLLINRILSQIFFNF